MLIFLVIIADLLLLYQMYREFQLYRAPQVGYGRSTVIVPLRGDEPGLIMNVNSLKKQDHKDYKLMYVVDHDEIEKQSSILRPLGVEIIESKELCQKCSGKVMAIITGINHAEGSNIVIGDSDTIYPKNWLSGMTSMLKYYQVVTTFSWPHPLKISVRNLIRSGFWTLGFESQAIGGRFLWGGSMAFRQNAIDQDIVEKLKNEWCDDCALTRISKERGWKIGYAGAAMPLNVFYEKNLIKWASRQAKLMIMYSKKGVYTFIFVTLFMLAFIVLFAITWNWFFLTPFVLWFIKNLLRGRKYGRLAIIPSLMSIPAMFFAIFMLAIGAKLKSVYWRDREYSMISKK